MLQNRQQLNDTVRRVTLDTMYQGLYPNRAPATVPSSANGADESSGEATVSGLPFEMFRWPHTHTHTQPPALSLRSHPQVPDP